MSRLSVLAPGLMVLSACGGCGEKAPTGASASASATAAATTTAVASATSNPAAPLVTLTSGATLQLPAGAEERQSPSFKRLPEVVTSAHVYTLPAGPADAAEPAGTAPERMLMVNELRVTKPCLELIAEEEKKLQQAAEKREHEELRRTGHHEIIELPVGHVLYAEALSKGLGKLAAQRAYSSLGTVTACSGDDAYTVVMAAKDTQAIPADFKPTLLALVKSYKPKAK